MAFFDFLVFLQGRHIDGTELVQTLLEVIVLLDNLCRDLVRVDSDSSFIHRDLKLLHALLVDVLELSLHSCQIDIHLGSFFLQLCLALSQVDQFLLAFRIIFFPPAVLFFPLFKRGGELFHGFLVT